MRHLYTVLLSILSFTTFAQNWNQVIKAVASDRSSYARYGTSVNIDGDIAIVGAYTEQFDASGSANMSEAGAAYVLEFIGGNWTETAKLVPSDRAIGDRFGYSVSISGNRAIVGAYQKVGLSSGGTALTIAGAAYIFELSGGVWSQTAKLQASDRQADDNFGNSVSISGDKVIIGAFLEDHDVTGGAQQPDAGSAYIFEFGGGAWTETAKLVASDRNAEDRFAWNVNISGNKAIVGAYQEDHDLSGGNMLGNAGSAYIFELNGGVWSETAKLIASDRATDDRFGWSVVISGNKAVIGAFLEDEDPAGGNTMSSAGAAYIFELSGGVWTQTDKLVASDRASGDQFGHSVSISGNRILVGADLQDHMDSAGVFQANAGAAYLFEFSGGTWTEIIKLVALDGSGNDYFGRIASISGNNLIVGAYAEDHNVQGFDALPDAGAAYVFNFPSGVGLIENDFGNGFQLYPNPTDGDFSIDLGKTHENITINITDVSGRVIQSKGYDNSQIVNLRLEEPAGIYFVYIQSGNEINVRQLVKQ